MLVHNVKPTFVIYPPQGTLKTPGRMRYNLFTEWASFKKMFKFQPIDAVRDYYGVKVAMYFAWLGFYTSMGRVLPTSSFNHFNDFDISYLRRSHVGQWMGLTRSEGWGGEVRPGGTFVKSS